jgi:O-antigen/teichoic acid export membrane protein
MNSENYTQLDKDFIRIFKITIIAAFGIAAFGEYIGLLLATKNFLGSMHLVPVFTIGYVFYQFAYAYLRNFGYSKSTHYMTITVLISGISNVLMNVILMKQLGEIGAAISFVLSYIIMAFVAWSINKFLVKLYSTPVKHMLTQLIIAAPFYFSLLFISNFNFLMFAIIVKIFLFILLTVILIWSEKNEILNYVRTILIRY